MGRICASILFVFCSASLCLGQMTVEEAQVRLAERQAARKSAATTEPTTRPTSRPVVEQPLPAGFTPEMVEQKRASMLQTLDEKIVRAAKVLKSHDAHYKGVPPKEDKHRYMLVNVLNSLRDERSQWARMSDRQIAEQMIAEKRQEEERALAQAKRNEEEKLHPKPRTLFDTAKEASLDMAHLLAATGRIQDAQYEGEFHAPTGEIGERFTFQFVTQSGLIRQNTGYIICRNVGIGWRATIVNIDGVSDIPATVIRNGGFIIR